MSFKRLTPDLSENILAASRSADRVITLAEDLRAAIWTVESQLQIIQQGGGKAEKLDYCISRLEVIHRQWNSMEIASLHSITIKNTCEQLWKNQP